MITVLNKILEVSNDPTVEALVEILKGKLEVIDAEVKCIEIWSGEAYQTGDDIYNAVDNIKAVTHGTLVRFSVIYFLADYVHMDEKIVDANFKKYQTDMQTAYPNLGELFEHNKTIPFVDYERLIISNWVNIDHMLNRSDDNLTYVSVKEEHKNVKIIWEW